jgi:penicillin-binding protein 1C
VQTGLRVPMDDGTRQVRREVYEFWPSDLMALFEKAGLPRRSPPPFMPETAGGVEMIARRGKPPQILSPQSNQTYAVHAAAGGSIESAIPLRAQAESDVSLLYWFADRAFLGTTSAHEALPWRPAPGSYRVVALDDHGRSSVCTARVGGLALVEGH